MQNLASGAWAPASSIPSLRRLAAQFRTSRTAVQAAIRRAARHGIVRIRPGRGTTVLPQAARKAARLLAALTARPALRRLAVLIPEQPFMPLKRNPFYARLVEAVGRCAQARNIRTEVVAWPVLNQVPMVSAVASGGYGAALAVGFRHKHMISLYMLHEQRFPLVTYNRRYKQFYIPSVRIDEYGAAGRITEQFVALGHRNLCFVTGQYAPVDDSDQDPFVQGWSDFLERRDLVADCVMPLHLVLTMGASPPAYDPAFARVLLGADRPTALLFSHMILADLFLDDPRFAALDVPGQLSLAAIDVAHNPRVSRRRPRLTSVSVNLPRVAQCAVELASKVMAGDLRAPSIRVPYVLETTESIGPPPPAGRL